MTPFDEITILKKHYQEQANGKTYTSPDGFRVSPAIRMAYGDVKKMPEYTTIPESYKQIILHAEPGTVLDDGVIQEYFGHALHVSA